MADEGHVVLIHAFPLGARLWRPQRVAPLPRRKLLTPDLPGFGASTEPPARSVEDMARAVLAELDAAGVRRAVIGGLSMGGYVTLALYRLAPERFAGMVLADTRATADSDQQREGRRRMIATARDRGPSAVADEMLPKLLGETSQRERPELAREVRDMIEENRGETIAAALEAMMGRPDSTPLLAAIAVPTLVICGDEDTLTPPSDSEALHRGIAGSRLVVLSGAGHLSSLEAPQAFSDALASFLATIPGSSAD
ncbi:MAG TPA: alpha/beta fold hydrolase [Vicinamibacterales bacterium]|nr:alpha/beta fold hydrolase [Vicinamibacterales bacterium]